MQFDGVRGVLLAGQNHPTKLVDARAKSRGVQQNTWIGICILINDVVDVIREVNAVIGIARERIYRAGDVDGVGVAIVPIGFFECVFVGRGVHIQALQWVEVTSLIAGLDGLNVQVSQIDADFAVLANAAQAWEINFGANTYSGLDIRFALTESRG